MSPSIHRSAAVLPAPAEEEEAAAAESPTDDPFFYGWRETRTVGPDGTETAVRIPLDYRDLLDPQEGDFIAEDSIHRKVTDDLARILRRHLAHDPSAVVWCNLKILFEIPGLTSGPGPDICVARGVEDPDRKRRSFRLGDEPGDLLLALEVVSDSSVVRDTRDILAIYEPMGIEEYVAIRPKGYYSTGPFELLGWRRDRQTGRLRPMRPDPRGRFHLRTVGLEFGPGEDGWGLELWEVATGERLRTAEEEADWHAARAREAEERERVQAERAAAEKLELTAEIERLQAALRERSETP